MSDTTFTKTTDADTTTYTGTVRKAAVTIFIGRSYTTVHVNNASAQVWRGPGKTFHHRDFAKMAEAYKSPQMKAFIAACAADFEAPAAEEAPAPVAQIVAAEETAFGVVPAKAPAAPTERFYVKTSIGFLCQMDADGYVMTAIPAPYFRPDGGKARRAMLFHSQAEAEDAITVCRAHLTARGKVHQPEMIAVPVSGIKRI